MPRRREVPERVIIPDVRFNSKLVSKFIACIMRDGKKSTAESIVYGAFGIIEEKTGKKIEHIAYPFGRRHEVNQREFTIVKKLAFKTATTIRRGPVYRAHKNHLMCLPRIMLTENFDMRSIGRIRRQRIVTL